MVVRRRPSWSFRQTSSSFRRDGWREVDLWPAPSAAGSGPARRRDGRCRNHPRRPRATWWLQDAGEGSGWSRSRSARPRRPAVADEGGSISLKAPRRRSGKRRCPHRMVCAGSVAESACAKGRETPAGRTPAAAVDARPRPSTIAPGREIGWRREANLWPRGVLE
jgi:hypothetical protein